MRSLLQRLAPVLSGTVFFSNLVSTREPPAVAAAARVSAAAENDAIADSNGDDERLQTTHDRRVEGNLTVIAFVNSSGNGSTLHASGGSSLEEAEEQPSSPPPSASGDREGVCSARAPDGSLLGCQYGEAKCRCSLLSRCYPRRVPEPWDGKGVAAIEGEAPGLVNVGVCGPPVSAMVALSVAVIFVMVALIVMCRWALLLKEDEPEAEELALARARAVAIKASSASSTSSPSASAPAPREGAPPAAAATAASGSQTQASSNRVSRLAAANARRHRPAGESASWPLQRARESS